MGFLVILMLAMLGFFGYEFILMEDRINDLKGEIDVLRHDLARIDADVRNIAQRRARQRRKGRK